MAKKGFTDKEKVERAKSGLLRALEEAKNNTNRTEAFGFVIGQIAHTFALLDSDIRDELGIVYVAANIMDEVFPREKKTYLQSPPTGKQLTLPQVKK